MQRLLLSLPPLAATLCLTACNEDEVDLEALATGDRTVRSEGTPYEHIFAFTLDGCNATSTVEERTQDGRITTRTRRIDLGTVDMSQMQHGTWDNASLGYVRLFTAEGASEFPGNATLSGTIDAGTRQRVLDAGGMCDAETCTETYTRPHVELSIRGPNPPENTRNFTEELTTLAATCAAN